MANEYRYFLESNFAGVNRLFVLIYSNQDENAERFKGKRYYLPKGVINNYNVIINAKKFYDQPMNSDDIKQYEEIRIKKLTIGYTTGCLLDYECIKNHYRLIAVDLRRHKELDGDPKSIQQIEFVGHLKKLDDNGYVIDAGQVLTKVCLF